MIKGLSNLILAREIEANKNSGGGTGDLPTPARPGQMLISKLNQAQTGIETAWKDIMDMISEETNLYSSDSEDVGKVFTKYGSGTRAIGWVKAQAAYTDYSNASSGLSATTVQGAIDEIASGAGGTEFNTKSGVGNGMIMGISEMVDIVDANGDFNLADDIEVSVIFGKIDATDPIMPKIPSPVAEWGYTISKNFIKEIYDGWVSAGKVSTYWNDFNQIKKGSETSMVTIFDMVDGDDQSVGTYNKDILMPLQLLFGEGVYGMCVYITPNPYFLTKDANSGNPIFSQESQASNNYGLQVFVRRKYIKPYN